ncbi:MAG: pirin family protein, partial [Acidimicrobiia bacterium]|nr:pirin family protein [Acidimicrobiia bacterium]
AKVDSTSIRPRTGARLDPERSTRITNLGGAAEFLLLQGRPIGAPVFQIGPFVMNTPEQLQQAFADYRRTQFGGWPWPSPSHVHDREEGRFALHVDGKIERRDMQAVR